MLGTIFKGSRETHHRFYQQYPRREALRYRLGEHDAVLLLSILGAISGLITGVVITLFRWVIEATAALPITLVNTNTETTLAQGYAALPEYYRLLLPLVGATVLGVIYQCIPKDFRHTGLSHVLVRLHRHNGKFRGRNALLQFFAGVFAISSGQSGGREGPAIHLGAAANSFFAKRLRLPQNSLRTLTACGCAAAIGASFNTPIAGVIFAMEVIMMEYTLVGFMPVMLASITATSFSLLIFGDELVFSLPAMSMQSLWEIPFLLFLGLACGFAAVLFMRIQLAAQWLLKLPVLFQFITAGLVTGAIAWHLPGVLGMGYDTINQALNSNAHWLLLAALCVGKIVATAVSSAVNMPIGIIGPSLFIGASIGGSLGFLAGEFQPELSAGAGFYALLGMGGVMGALLNAPLAALIAILELAHSPGAMLPGIIVIITAALCTDQIFGQHSAVETVLRSQGIALGTHPVAQALNRIALSAVVDTNIHYLNNAHNDGEGFSISLDEGQRSIVFQTSDGMHYRLSRKNLALLAEKLRTKTSEAEIDQSICVRNECVKVSDNDQLLATLIEYEISCDQLIDIEISATVTQARDVLREHAVDGLFVYDEIGSLRGILRAETLNKLIASW